MADKNECESNPCKHSGTCTDALNRYTCNCAPGFTDSNCETRVYVRGVGVRLLEGMLTDAIFATADK